MCRCDEAGTAVYRIQIHVIRQHVTMVWQYGIDNADATDVTDCDEVRVRRIKNDKSESLVSTVPLGLSSLLPVRGDCWI